MSLKPSDLWRTNSSRLLLIFGALFTLWCAALIGVIQWNTTRYLSNIVDLKLDNLSRYFTTLDRDRLREAIVATEAFDLRDVLSHGVFDRDGKLLMGNLASVPPELPLDGAVHLLTDGVQRTSGYHAQRARGIAVHLTSGELLVLVRDTSVIDAVGAIIWRAMLFGLPLIVVPGLIGALLLSRGPRRRVQAIEAAVQPIMRGDPHLVFEALSNLVDNAIKFTPPQGTVRVHTSIDTNGPRIDVIDNGPGIRACDRGAVVQRFYRGGTAPAEQGQGLGLAIVAAIVKLHSFSLEIGEGASGGAKVSLMCWPTVDKAA